MGLYAPPYANKHEKMLEKKLATAEKKEATARAKYEEAMAYTKLCRDELANAKK